MQRASGVPANPDAYVAALRGWRRELVETLRAAARSGRGLDEVVKWGHLVYLGYGPVLLIRAEAERVLFGFWRGRHLRDIEPRLKAGGNYEMATLDLRKGDTIAPATAKRLVRQAVALDHEHGDPTRVAPRTAKRTARPSGSARPADAARPARGPGKGSKRAGPPTPRASRATTPARKRK